MADKKDDKKDERSEKDKAIDKAAKDAGAPSPTSTDAEPTPKVPGQPGSVTGGATTPSAAPRNDATDPLQAPQLDASPERFLAHKPEHIKAQGAAAPPVPDEVARLQAETEEAERRAEEEQGKRRFKLSQKSGWFDGNVMHQAGATVALNQEQHAKLREVPRATTQASGFTTR